MRKNTMHMIVRGMKTPNHSKDRRIDDSHRVKQEILKACRQAAGEFADRVGKNPDIDIDKESMTIVLKGVHEKFKGKEFNTDLDANEYFDLMFLYQESSDFFEFLIASEQTLDFAYRIPYDESILSSLLDYILTAPVEHFFLIEILF